MVIITIETTTFYYVRTMSYMQQDINWSNIMKVMVNDKAQYSVRVLEIK